MQNTIQLENFTLLRMGLGTNRITNSIEAHALLRFAYDQGIHFYDTANIYQDGESELAIAAALKPYAAHLCIATKGGFRKDAPGVYTPEGHPPKLRENLDASLMRLGVEQIDLYQLHRIDPDVPMEESVGALKDLQSEGKIRYIGLSEVSVSQLEKALSIVQIVSVQNRYNVFERNHEAVVDYCNQQGIVFIAFFPLGSARHLFPTDMLHTLNTIAAQYNKTPQQVALAWLLQRAASLLPIPGTLSTQHLSDNIAALSFMLSAEDVKKINACAAPNVAAIE